MYKSLTKDEQMCCSQASSAYMLHGRMYMSAHICGLPRCGDNCR